MLTFYHSPKSRSSAVAVLIDEMGIADRIDLRIVAIPRQDGSGRRDPANPHPEGKVPALDHDGNLITERGAIMVHLTTLFPEAGLAPAVGTPDWGSYLSWMVWYQGVLEPVMILDWAKIGHPALTATFRGLPEAVARIGAALAKGPWLLGERFSAADLLVHSPFAFFPERVPDDPPIRDWVARCRARPSIARVAEADTARMAAL